MVKEHGGWQETLRAEAEGCDGLQGSCIVRFSVVSDSFFHF